VGPPRRKNPVTYGMKNHKRGFFLRSRKKRHTGEREKGPPRWHWGNASEKIYLIKKKKGVPFFLFVSFILIYYFYVWWAFTFLFEGGRGPKKKMIYFFTRLRWGGGGGPLCLGGCEKLFGVCYTPNPTHRAGATTPRAPTPHTETPPRRPPDFGDQHPQPPPAKKTK